MMIADGKGKGKYSVCAFLGVASSTRLFKQNGYTPIEVHVSRASAWIIIIIIFFRKIQGLNVVQAFLKIGRNGFSQRIILLGYQRMHSVWLTWLEEESGVRAHFMVIGIQVWLPLVNPGNSPLCFRQLNRNVIPVEIEPIVVSAASWPGFILFEIVGICDQVLALM